jgi:hypothetical protein
MQKDLVTNAVTQMNEEEIDLFLLYRTQLATPSGRCRDDLPFTPEFNNLRHQYNKKTTSKLNDYELWGKLKSILKCGVKNIEVYLQSVGVITPPKP